MEQHRTISFQGHNIHYRDEGRSFSNTLVLLHGFLQSQEVWSSFTLSYMRQMRVIAIDLPGHGYSECYGPVHTMEFMAEAVKAVLDEAGVDQCVMVGHSMGGYVAMAFADLYPYQLRGLGLIHAHAMADSEEHLSTRQLLCANAEANRAGFILNFIPSLFDESKKLALAQEIKDLQEQSLETTLQGILAAQRGMAERPSRVDVMQRLEIPVLFIYGKNDPRLPIELAVAQAMVPHYAEIMLLDKVAHMAHFEERDYVKLRLRNFVDTCFF